MPNCVTIILAIFVALSKSLDAPVRMHENISFETKQIQSSLKSLTGCSFKLHNRSYAKLRPVLRCWGATLKTNQYLTLIKNSLVRKMILSHLQCVLNIPDCPRTKIVTDKSLKSDPWHLSLHPISNLQLIKHTFKQIQLQNRTFRK